MNVLVAIVGLLALTVSAGVKGSEAQVPPLSPLEKAFLNIDESDLEFLYRVSELPEDVLAKLRQSTNDRRVANLGETWNATDVIGDEEATYQHRFTFLTSTLGGTYYLSGGHGVRGNLLLYFRGRLASTTYCHYLLEPELSVAIDVKYIFENIRVYGHESPYYPYPCTEIELRDGS